LARPTTNPTLQDLLPQPVDEHFEQSLEQLEQIEQQKLPKPQKTRKLSSPCLTCREQDFEEKSAFSRVGGAVF
jgi:hypothetical protein